ncbi:enoyl-CoA hydratase [Sphingomonas turrisvirgatae]|uniref:Enoyl-CoA hydratase n=1 Tax=Sphingomonas turrisvirgatae TaxID=1888892 RepID=A0A1E3LXI3_9SPHN|nr:enoyl-CoA hydratase [Sphingomonas turrisvirgatae]
MLLIERRNGYAVVTLNRPEALNALSEPLVARLAETLETLEADPQVRGLIVTGTGRAFCAGMDIKELQDPNGPLSRPGGLWADGTLNPILRLRGFAKPTIAAVNGAAVTGGFELALACDLIVASSAARFADTHARVGIIPGGGLSQHLSRVIGIHRAKELHLTGNFLSAEQADRWGLVNRVVAPEELLPVSEALMRDMLGIEQAMLVSYKRLIDGGYALGFGDALAEEARTAKAEANRTQADDIAQREDALLDRGRTQAN